MSKSGKINNYRVYSLIKEFGAANFSFDGVKITCKLCMSELNGSKIQYIENHCRTRKHIENLARVAEQNTTFRNHLDSELQSDFCQ